MAHYRGRILIHLFGGFNESFVRVRGVIREGVRKASCCCSDSTRIFDFIVFVGIESFGETPPELENYIAA